MLVGIHVRRSDGHIVGVADSGIVGMWVGIAEGICVGFGVGCTVGEVGRGDACKCACFYLRQSENWCLLL